MPKEEQDWFDKELRDLVSQIRKGYAINGTAKNTEELEDLAVIVLQDLFIKLVEQESF